VVGQFLLGRKFIENWAVWVLVNGVSVALFAYKGLWLTAGLYLVFIVLSVVGWRAWQRRLVARIAMKIWPCWAPRAPARRWLAGEIAQLWRLPGP
jgi:nicotinamide riboside transporter PnuC